MKIKQTAGMFPRIVFFFFLSNSRQSRFPRSWTTAQSFSFRNFDSFQEQCQTFFENSKKKWGDLTKNVCVIPMMMMMIYSLPGNGIVFFSFKIEYSIFPQIILHHQIFTVDEYRWPTQHHDNAGCLLMSGNYYLKKKEILIN